MACKDLSNIKGFGVHTLGPGYPGSNSGVTAYELHDLGQVPSLPLCFFYSPVKTKI